MNKYPTPWQQKTIWAAVTTIAVVIIGAIAVELVILGARALHFLQPLLLPIAISGIIAYLLNPVVEKLCAKGVARTTAVAYVFALVLLPLVLIAAWIIPQIYDQSALLASNTPEYISSSQAWIAKTIQKYKQLADNQYVKEAITWLQQQLPTLPPKLWGFVTGSIEGFMGVFGFLLGLLIVPISLFYFLRDGAMIAKSWSDYLPLRTSAFKTELVACLTEINKYLIAFFRGQLLVSLVDGLMIGTALLLMGLHFGLLIGLLVAVLALVPYLGIILCWLPAVILAALQRGDWHDPLYVTIIFIVAQQIEGWFIAPKIVGESVGLHPLTVMVSVLGWSLLIGGLLGAMLAVPLTATLKVLLKRYVWEASAKSSLIQPITSQVAKT